MLIIPVKEGESIDKALKRFKRKFDKTGALKSLRERQAFTKPSVKNRNKFIKASHVQKLRDQENQ
ncbi:MAG: 30S ribosomal protein S21 [Flavobacteriaceae bacterium]|jgi:small subunit ribosomal protein S21|nr:30S ribosomal protein S21 [Flavobacteriaceae bacterium]|tara:strand:+ start:21452 stop:21646 length:195 start_codon:yes stop_codon:yes gene_type:complete